MNDLLKRKKGELFAFSEQLESIYVGDVLESCFDELGSLFDCGGAFACPFVFVEVKQLGVDEGRVEFLVPHLLFD